LRRARAGAENGLFAALFGAGREVRVLLAMQKVEGSNPFSRFPKGVHLQVFFVYAVGGPSAFRRTETGPAASREDAAAGKAAVCRAM
jgi:hypothetical protein